MLHAVLDLSTARTPTLTVIRSHNNSGRQCLVRALASTRSYSLAGHHTGHGAIVFQSGYRRHLHRWADARIRRRGFQPQDPKGRGARHRRCDGEQAVRSGGRGGWRGTRPACNRNRERECHLSTSDHSRSDARAHRLHARWLWAPTQGSPQRLFSLLWAWRWRYVAARRSPRALKLRPHCIPNELEAAELWFAHAWTHECNRTWDQRGTGALEAGQPRYCGTWMDMPRLLQ